MKKVKEVIIYGDCRRFWFSREVSLFFDISSPPSSNEPSGRSANSATMGFFYGPYPTYLEDSILEQTLRLEDSNLRASWF